MTGLNIPRISQSNQIIDALIIAVSLYIYTIYRVILADGLFGGFQSNVGIVILVVS